MCFFANLRDRQVCRNDLNQVRLDEVGIARHDWTAGRFPRLSHDIRTINTLVGIERVPPGSALARGGACFSMLRWNLIRGCTAIPTSALVTLSLRRLWTINTREHCRDD